MKKNVWFALFVGLIAVTVLPLITNQNFAETGASNNSNLQAQVQAANPSDLPWNPNPDIAGVESAIALGNPSKAKLYVLYGKMVSGTVFPAHTHPDDRITTVISGVMYYGVGEKFDRTNLSPYAAGSVIYTPAETPHFMWVEDNEAVMQEAGFGPTGMKFIESDE